MDQRPSRSESLGLQCIPGVAYQTVPALGVQHWGLNITNMTADGWEGQAGHCSTPPYCAAIIDSGTSLIALPDAMLNDLKDGRLKRKSDAN